MEHWELIARESIRDLAARYNANGDAGRIDQVVELFAEDAVLDKAGVALDKEGQPLDPKSQQEAISKPNEEELERMSAFRDFIEGLDLDDFDKRKS